MDVTSSVTRVMRRSLREARSRRGLPAVARISARCGSTCVGAGTCYLPFALLLWAAQHYLLFNLTPSLPYSVVWLDRDRPPSRGDLIVFRFEGEELMQLRKGQRFFKRIVGLPGDAVSVDGRRVLVNGTDVGVAKQYTRDGHRLEPIAAGVIPPGTYYVQGTHAIASIRAIARADWCTRARSSARCP